MGSGRGGERVPMAKAKCSDYLLMINSNQIGVHPAGAVMKPPQKLWLVTEFIEGGTLHEWIYGRT